MAISSKETLKTFYQTGDVPTEAQFGDLIDTAAFGLVLNGVDFTLPGYVASSSGGVVGSATRVHSDFQYIGDSPKITVRGFTNGGSVGTVCYYDIDKVFISALTTNSLVEFEILQAEFPVGAAYVRCSGAGDGKDFLNVATVGSVNEAVAQLSIQADGVAADVVAVEASVVNLTGEVAKANASVEVLYLEDTVTVNDTPARIFNLNTSLTETIISNRSGYGNRFIVTADKTFNLLQVMPASLVNDLSGTVTVEVLNVTDGGSMFAVNVPSLVWNESQDVLLTIPCGTITFENGKEYRVGYRFNDTITAEPRYKRVARNDTDVVQRIAYSGSSWGNIGSNFNTYMELLFSADFDVSTKILVDASQVIGLGDPILETLEIVLPEEIIVAKGVTIELYNEQLIDVPDKHNYFFDYSCTTGKHKARKFTVTGSDANLGTYSLGISVRNKDLVTVATKTVSLKIIDKTSIASPYRLLPVGASYTNNKAWYNAWKDLALTKLGSRDEIDFVGTIPGTWGSHEGRSGWTANRYLGAGSNESANVILNVSGVTETPIFKKGYNVPLAAGGTTTFEVEVVDLTAGSGTIQLTRTGVDGLVAATGSITEVESGTAGDATVAYSALAYDSANPFYNSATSAVDFANYSTVNGIAAPDGVQFLIGTNNLSGGTSAIDSGNAALKTLVDQIIADWGQVDIFICLIPFLSDQNGLGKTYGAGTFGNKENLDKLVFYASKSVMEVFAAYTNVYFTPVAQTHDSKYNFGRVAVDVNPRNSNYVEYDPVEGVHPQTEGYNQFADSMFSTWLDRI